jgi:hypothetical protein
MSIGNTKDKGNNYGNNYPYQLAVLKLLDQIASSTGSKMDRIKSATNYNRAFTYDPVGTENITVIVHTGTTALGAETITETFTYVDPTTNGSNITNIAYS